MCIDVLQSQLEMELCCFDNVWVLLKSLTTEFFKIRSTITQYSSTSTVFEIIFALYTSKFVGLFGFPKSYTRSVNSYRLPTKRLASATATFGEYLPTSKICMILYPISFVFSIPIVKPPFSQWIWIKKGPVWAMVFSRFLVNLGRGSQPIDPSGLAHTNRYKFFILSILFMAINFLVFSFFFIIFISLHTSILN